MSEPRSNNRNHLDIVDDDLPFVGFDTWNAYEVSALTNNGLPVAGVTKVIYPCDSKYIVESKSIKLYFNSFNMYKCGDTPEQVMNFIDLTASNDLSRLLETNVIVKTLPASGRAPGETVLDHNKYITLEDIYTQEQLSKMKLDVYNESPELLELVELENVEVTTSTTRYHSSLLKSNCRVTSQPDWGDVYIMCQGHQHVTPESLLKYIVSFRDECHFHEEICETIYKRLYDILSPERLCVTCLYARRGGIDINPVRGTDLPLVYREAGDLGDETIMHVKTSKQ